MRPCLSGDGGGQHKGAVGFYKVVRSHTKRCQDLQPHAVQTKTVCDEGELWCEPDQIVSSLWRRGENRNLLGVTEKGLGNRQWERSPGPHR